ncbi:MAG TPA: substrate-binding domain-containing protein [Vicinamibacteria bacterium]|nr:substrate-binding domain-containing protein [Vicinamibacteria bacterium]
MADRHVFVLLIGNKERGEVNHFQLLQEDTAKREGRRLGFEIEVAFAPGFDQLRTVKKRMSEAGSTVDAVVTEPANNSTMDLMLGELRGRSGLIILSAWGPSVEQAATSWGKDLPMGSVGTDHVRVGEIQGRQVNALVPSGGRVLYVAGPLRSSAAQQRLSGLKSQLGPAVRLEEISAGQWTESDGIVAFNDWYRVAKGHDPVVPVIAAGNDELALGARRACEALANAQHREALLRARFLGVDACPSFGQKLIAEKQLHASVITPANTGLALGHLHRYWTEGTPVPLRSFTEAQPFPASSVAA